MKTLGKHVILELYGIDNNTLDDIKKLEEALKTAAVSCGATIIKPVFHRFSPYGVSGILVVAESHFSIHTWPEYNYAAIDIFTCGSRVNPYIAVKTLINDLKPEKYTISSIDRGCIIQ